jgi:hypothetical protein
LKTLATTQGSGVTFKRQRSRWIVRELVDGKRKQIGSFKTLAEANALVANNSQNGGFDSNTLYASHSEIAPNPSRSQSDLKDDGDHNNKVSIGVLRVFCFVIKM